MGWLSRSKKPQDGSQTYSAPTDGAPAPLSVPSAPVPTAAQPDGTQPPMGRYGPQVGITHFDVAPDEFGWQLPLNGEMYRLIPGPDRPDYSIMLLDRPLHFYPDKELDLDRVDQDLVTEDRQGRTMVRAHALVVCSRFAGQQLHPGMRDLPVNIATVIANTTLQDAQLDFAKISYVGVGFLSEGHAVVSEAGEPDVPASQPEADEADAVAAPEVEPETAAAAEVEPETAVAPPRVALDEVFDEVARTLRQGIAEQRGADVATVNARLTLDAQHRVSGLSGNADGGPPVPTPATFERLNEVLAQLPTLLKEARVQALTVTVESDHVTHQVEYAVDGG